MLQYVCNQCVCGPAALGLDLEQPDYDMDSEDETLLNRLNRKMEIKPLQFETMVDRLEKASTHQVTHTHTHQVQTVWTQQVIRLRTRICFIQQSELLSRSHLVFVLVVPSSAGVSDGGEAAAERGRLLAEVGVWLLGEEEEELSRPVADSSHQTGEKRRIHQQWCLRGLQTEDGEDADQEGQSVLLSVHSWLSSGLMNTWFCL